MFPKIHVIKLQKDLEIEILSASSSKTIKSVVRIILRVNENANSFFYIKFRYDFSIKPDNELVLFYFFSYASGNIGKAVNKATELSWLMAGDRQYHVCLLFCQHLYHQAYCCETETCNFVPHHHKNTC